MSALGDALTLRLFPMPTVEEARRSESRAIDAVEASCVHSDLVGLRAGDIERVHAAMSAEGMLRHTGLKGVDRQRILATQQLEIGRKHRKMENPLLRAHGATALRKKVQIDPGAEPYLTAATAAFSRFQHLLFLPKPHSIVASRGTAVHPAHCGVAGLAVRDQPDDVIAFASRPRAAGRGQTRAASLRSALAAHNASPHATEGNRHADR